MFRCCRVHGVSIVAAHGAVRMEWCASLACNKPSTPHLPAWRTAPLPSPPHAPHAKAHRATSCTPRPRASASSRSGACTRAAAARGRAPPTSTRRTPRARRRRRPIGCLLVWLLIWECVWGVVCVIWCCPCVVVLVCVPREGKDYGGSPHACMHEVCARAYAPPTAAARRGPTDPPPDQSRSWITPHISISHHDRHGMSVCGRCWWRE